MGGFQSNWQKLGRKRLDRRDIIRGSALTTMKIGIRLLILRQTTSNIQKRGDTVKHITTKAALTQRFVNGY